VAFSLQFYCKGTMWYNVQMRILLIILLCTCTSAYAIGHVYDTKTLPDSVFKKKFNGQIVQYDKNGKKIGVYKQKNGRYIRIK